MLLTRQRELGELPAVFAREVGATLAEAIARRLPDLPEGAVEISSSDSV